MYELLINTCNMIKFSGRLVEVSELGSYQGSPYASCKVRTQTARGEEIVKFKIDVKELDRDAVAELLDSDVEITCNLERGNNDVASLRVVAIE